MGISTARWPDTCDPAVPPRTYTGRLHGRTTPQKERRKIGVQNRENIMFLDKLIAKKVAAFEQELLQKYYVEVENM